MINHLCLTRQKYVVGTSVFIKNLVRRNMAGAVVLFATLFAAMTFSSVAHAVNCSGAITPTSNSFVFYDASAGTCSASDSSSTRDTGDIYVAISPLFGGGTTITMNADNNLDGSGLSRDHLGCTVGDAGAVAAGDSCSDISIASGTYTSTLRAHVDADSIATFSMTYTVVAGTSVTISSASVTLPTSSSTSSSATPSTAEIAQITQSQTRLVSTNIGARITAIGSPAGVGRATPNGAGRDVPGGNTDTTAQNSLTGLVAMPWGWNNGQSDDVKETSHGADSASALREIAMRASFDVSSLVLIPRL